MDKMKKYLIYILLIIAFAIFTKLLISVGLNSSYEKITRRDDSLSQVVIYQAEATNVSGRLRGIINNDKKNIDTKYLKLDFYSSNNVNMGSKYIEIDKNKTETPIEVFFKLNDVKSYKVSLVNEKEPLGEIEFIPKDLSKQNIVLAALITALLVW